MIRSASAGSISRPSLSRVAKAFACVQVSNLPNSCWTLGPGRSSVARHTTAASPQYFCGEREPALHIRLDCLKTRCIYKQDYWMSKLRHGGNDSLTKYTASLKTDLCIRTGPGD